MAPGGVGMKRAVAVSSARLLAGALLTLLTGGLLAPGVAHAGCGDYVVMGSHPAHQTTSPAPRQGPTTAASPTPDRPGPKPCSGPACSRGSLPPAEPAPLPPPRGDQWAWV